MYQFSFERLEVWQLARKLATDVYKITAGFPSEEKFGLVSQMRRAASSVCANLAEGSSRTTAKDQANFTSIAFSSLMELYNHMILSGDLGFIQEEQLNDIRMAIQQLSVKLSNYRSAQLKRSEKDK